MASRRLSMLTLSLSGLSLSFCVSVVQSGPPFYRDKSKLLVYLDAEGKEHPITKAAAWPKRREHILANMQEVMGPLPDASQKVPLDVQITEEKKTDKWVRKKLTFASEKDDHVPAYLFLPHGQKGKLPAVLCLHQTNGKRGKAETAGLSGNPDLHYALHLAERGYVTLALDYPNFGEYEIDVYQRGYQSASMKAIWNNMRAIDLLQSLPEVDPERIGCIGHSLGGHNTMFTAVFDQRIKALVSNCGFNSFYKYYGGNLKGWSHKGYMPRIASIYEMKPEKMPFDFTEVVAALAPRAFLASAPIHDDNFDVSGVKDCIAAAQPVYELLEAKEKLSANYPDCKHDFPPGVRKVAYEWLDRWLKEGMPPKDKSEVSGTRRIILRVAETAGIRRFGYPVSVVLRLTEPVKEADHFRLLEGDKPIAAQFRPHGDTSKGIRAVSLDFNASPAPLERRDYVVEYGPGISATKPKEGLRVETTDKEFRVVHPSGLVFAVPRDLQGLLNEVRTEKTKYLRPESAGLYLVGLRDLEFAPDNRPRMSGKVVKEGPLAVGLRFESSQNRPAAVQASSVVNLDFPISKSWVRVDWSVEDPKGDITALGAEFNLNVEGEPVLVDFGAGTSVYAQLSKGDGARLRQNPYDRAKGIPSWDVFLGPWQAWRAFVVAPETKRSAAMDTEGWAHVMDRERCTAVAIADFSASKWGAEIKVSGKGKLLLYKGFDEADVKGSKRLTFWLHFVPMPVHVGAATSPQAMLAPLHVEVVK